MEQLPPQPTTQAERWREASQALVRSQLALSGALVDAWATVTTAARPDETTTNSLVNAYARAYREWVAATERAATRFASGAVETPLDASQVLAEATMDAVDNTYAEFATTDAFAEAAGGGLDAALSAVRWRDAGTKSLLRAAGLPTGDDVAEVGARLLEIQRQQRALADAVDRLAAAQGDQQHLGPETRE